MADCVRHSAITDGTVTLFVIGHLKSMGPSLIVPVAKGKLTLGTWQQIVLIDFDTRSRNRQIAVTIMGL